MGPHLFEGGMNRVVIGSGLVLAAAALWAAWRFLSASPEMESSSVIAAGDGHAQACPVSTGRSRAGRYRVRRIVTVCRSERYRPRT